MLLVCQTHQWSLETRHAEVLVRHLVVRHFIHAGAGWISQALKEHTNERLVELDLGYNEIKDEGACAVAQVWMAS